VNPNFSKQKSLHFVGFLWPKQAFSTRYGRKNKKIRFPLHSRCRLRKAVSNAPLLLPPLGGVGIRSGE
jgi:hypothetical protein